MQVNSVEPFLPEDAELGQEFLLRVRLVEISEEITNVTSFGSPEPQVLSGERSGRIVLLAVREA